MKATNKETISISVIVGNAADTLDIFFYWALANFEEVNVVVQPDNYDNSLEICKYYGATHSHKVNLLVHEFDDFSSQFDRSIALSTCDFTIVLGSDEILTEFPYQQIPFMMNRLGKDVGVLSRYNLQRDIYHYNQQGYPDIQSRIIRISSGIHFNGRAVDETLDIPDGSSVVLNSIQIIHFGHIRPKYALRQKGIDRKKFAHADRCDGPQLNKVGIDWFIIRNKAWDEQAQPLPNHHISWLDQWIPENSEFRNV